MNINYQLEVDEKLDFLQIIRRKEKNLGNGIYQNIL